MDEYYDDTSCLRGVGKVKKVSFSDLLAPFMSSRNETRELGEFLKYMLEWDPG